MNVQLFRISTLVAFWQRLLMFATMLLRRFLRQSPLWMRLLVNGATRPKTSELHRVEGLSQDSLPDSTDGAVQIAQVEHMARLEPWLGRLSGMVGFWI